MVTRFDKTTEWVTADGRQVTIQTMDTIHIMNTLRMFIRRPSTVAALLIADIEKAPRNDCSSVWSPNASDTRNVVKESMFAVTSMSYTDLSAYALNSPLGRSMMMELDHRGVNTSNLIQMWMEDSNERDN